MTSRISAAAVVAAASLILASCFASPEVFSDQCMNRLRDDAVDPDEPCPTPPPMAPVHRALNEPGFVPDPMHAPMCDAFGIVDAEIQPAFQQFEDASFADDPAAMAEAGAEISDGAAAIEVLAMGATDPGVRADLEALAHGFQRDGRRAAAGDITDRSAREVFRGFLRRYESQCQGLRPDDRPLTRAQVAMRIADELDLPPTTADRFDDDDGTDAEDALNRLAAAGALEGCGDRAVCPDAPVSRGELAAYLAHALRLPATTDDAFADDDGSRFEPSINETAAAGLVTGHRDQDFRPDAAVTTRDLDRFMSRAHRRLSVHSDRLIGVAGGGIRAAALTGEVP